MRDLAWFTLHCRRIFLRGLRVQAWIGVHAFEKNAPQAIVLDIDLYVALQRPAADALSEVVDYDFVRQLVHGLVAAGPIELQETLCDRVLDGLLVNPAVRAARVSTRKPDVYPDCEAVGVEAFRLREPAP